jgi:hypothetical protein
MTIFEELRALGVKRIAMPKIGRLNSHQKKNQNKSWFKRLQRFRCGIEASISMLKRVFGLRDSQVRGTEATATWTAFAILSYNLWQLTG